MSRKSPSSSDSGDSAARASQIRGEYTRGELVRVAGGRNQAEAELIENILLAEGIPSVIKRTAGFDVPDYLAGVPRDVLVAASAVDAARELLEGTELAPLEAPAAAPRRPLLTAAVVVALVTAALLVVWLLWLALPAGS